MLAALIAGILVPACGFAAEPQFGRWAADAQYCSGGGDSHRSAPLTVTPTSLRWAAEFCTIGKMYKADRALYIEGRCSNSGMMGMMVRRPITLAMKGERLAVTWNGEHSEMRRCP